MTFMTLIFLPRLQNPRKLERTTLQMMNNKYFSVNISRIYVVRLIFLFLVVGVENQTIIARQHLHKYLRAVACFNWFHRIAASDKSCRQ